MNDKEILNEIKYRVGIFYTDEQVDKSIENQINECKQYLKTAGVTDLQLTAPLALTLYEMWVNSSRAGNIHNLPTSPAFISFIIQLHHYEPVKEIKADA